MVRNLFPEFCDEYSKLSCIGYIYIDPSQLGCFKIEDATTDDIFAMLILDNNNIIDMIDNFISEFSITNSWNAEKWSRLIEDVKNMTNGDSRKRSMRKLRAIVFAANKFIVNKGNYVTHQYVYLYPYSPYALECNLQSKHPQYPLNGKFDGIYVRDAVIFREAENKGYKLLQNPFNMSFISVLAIREPILNDGMLNKRDIIIAKDKIRTILRLGLINSHDALVLGAWSCGIFHNPPRAIARLFKEVFLEEEFFNKYKKVVFAILDSISLSRKKDDGNLLPFKELFDK